MKSRQIRPVRESLLEGTTAFDTAQPIPYTSDMLRVAVIDGQGGGIGNLVVKRLREEFKDTVEIIALGTNAAATASMMKARANKGATGENAIVWNSQRVDVIVGPLSIVLPDAMLGEVTAKMASAVVASAAKTILLPLNQEEIEIAGANKEPLPHMIEHIVSRIKEIENVDVMRPEEGKIFLKNLFGEQKVFEGQIREISLLRHKILLEKK
jgi:predicted RNA-binding protein